MPHPIRLAVISAATCLLMVGPALAGGSIQGAGSGTTGGTITGKTNETSPALKTGADNGDEAVPSRQNKGHSVGTGDNAVLNAPREAVPGTLPKSQPSNLNGQDQ